LDMIVTKKWFQVFVNLMTDLSSEPLRTQRVAGSIPASGIEICAFFVLS